MSHTPGPWCIVEGSRGLSIGYIDDPEMPPKGLTSMRDPLNEADARAIAALPDLLEAAQEVVKQFADYPFTDDRGVAIDALIEAVSNAGGRVE